MQTEIQKFLDQNYSGIQFSDLEKIAESGSNRKYFRFDLNSEPVILTYSLDKKENESFFYFTETFKNLNVNVPEILTINESKTIYTQSDLGNISLLQTLKENQEESYPIYQATIKQLAQLQISSDSILDYAKCYDFQRFDKLLILRDLFYFKDYFLDLLPIEYSGKKLLEEFETLATEIENSSFQYFMFRDFQGRNVMVKENQPYFIDYQGGMKGAIQYDLASLLWQAKAEISDDWKAELYDLYLEEVKQYLPNKDFSNFKRGYELCVIERLLQVLGAYGFRGIYERKSHFLESIDYGIKNLEEIYNWDFLNRFLTIKGIIHKIIQPETKTTIQKLIK